MKKPQSLCQRRGYHLWNWTPDPTARGGSIRVCGSCHATLPNDPPGSVVQIFGKDPSGALRQKGRATLGSSPGFSSLRREASAPPSPK